MQAISKCYDKARKTVFKFKLDCFFSSSSYSLAFHKRFLPVMPKTFPMISSNSRVKFPLLMAPSPPPHTIFLYLKILLNKYIHFFLYSHGSFLDSKELDWKIGEGRVGFGYHIIIYSQAKQEEEEIMIWFFLTYFCLLQFLSLSHSLCYLIHAFKKKKKKRRDSDCFSASLKFLLFNSTWIEETNDNESKKLSCSKQCYNHTQYFMLQSKVKKL